MQVRILTVILFSIFSQVALAQDDQLIIQGSSPALYLTHTVVAKENWYSLGRLYNASPKEVASYNALSIDKPLTIGQLVKVPLKITNFSQNGQKAADEVLVPVYHVIQDKEWMYRISTNYNKVPIERLEKWNGITNDQVKAGMMLIVGYLKVKKDQSALAALANRPAAVGSAPSPPVTTANMPPVTATVKKEEKPAEPVTKQDNKTVQQPVAEEKKPVVVNKPVQTAPPANTASAGNGNGGYFRNLYEDSGKAANGMAGVFKSTSGWQDTKYYALMDNVSVGTIIKVVNPATSKTVYAKVLGELPDMKESIGLTVRISDAAATELGVAEGKFSVAVRY
jgi:LysM repeat protein